MTKRLFVILFGFLCSCLAATVAHVILLMPIMNGWSISRLVDELSEMGPLVIGLVFFVYVFLTMIPSAIVIIIAEYFKFQKLSYYVFGGVLITCFAVILFLETDSYDFSVKQYREHWVTLPLGFLSSLVYWFIAGHDAGNFGGDDLPTLSE